MYLKILSYSSKKIHQNGKTSTVEDEDVEIIGTRPATSRTFSPNIRKIEFPQTWCLSDRGTVCNWQYHGA